MTDKILTFTLSNGDVVEYTESEICDLIENWEFLKHTWLNPNYNEKDVIEFLTEILEVKQK